jgi:hypothetical protein
MKTKHNACWIKLSMMNQCVCVCVCVCVYYEIKDIALQSANIRFLIKIAAHPKPCGSTPVAGHCCAFQM